MDLAGSGMHLVAVGAHHILSAGEESHYGGKNIQQTNGIRCICATFINNRIWIKMRKGSTTISYPYK